MKSDAELFELAAKEIMEFKKRQSGYRPGRGGERRSGLAWFQGKRFICWDGHWNPLTAVHSDLIVDKMVEKGWFVSIINVHHIEFGVMWRTSFAKSGPEDGEHQDKDRLRAILIASLLAVGTEVE